MPEETEPIELTPEGKQFNADNWVMFELIHHDLEKTEDYQKHFEREEIYAA